MKVSHNEKGYRNNYCGPAAMSVLTGLTAETSAAILRLWTNKSSIRGLFTHDLVSCLKGIGKDVREQFYYDCRQLKVKGLSKKLDAKKTYLVVVTGHFIVVKGSRFWDNSNVNGAPVSKLSRRHVKSVYEVSGQVNKNHVMFTTLADIKKTKKAKRFGLARVKELLREMKVDVEDIDFRMDYIDIDAPEGFHFMDGIHWLTWYRQDGGWDHVISDLECGLTKCDENCGGLD